MNININQRVRVTLTVKGVQRLKKYYSDLNFEIPVKQWRKEAGDVIEMTIWELMMIFGPGITMGPGTLFHNNNLELIEPTARVSDMIPVRIAVAVDEKGYWHSAGWDGCEDNIAMETASEGMGLHERFFIKAMVSKPEKPKEVKGKTEEA